MGKSKLEDSLVAKLIVAGAIIGASVWIGCYFGVDPHVLHILEYILEHFR